MEPGTGVPSIVPVRVPTGHQLLMSTEFSVTANDTGWLTWAGVR